MMMMSLGLQMDVLSRCHPFSQTADHKDVTWGQEIYYYFLATCRTWLYHKSVNIFAVNCSSSTSSSVLPLLEDVGLPVDWMRVFSLQQRHQNVYLSLDNNITTVDSHTVLQCDYLTIKWVSILQVYILLAITPSVSALTPVVWWQGGHPAWKKVGCGLFMETIWLELCTSYRPPPPSALLQ